MICCPAPTSGSVLITVIECPTTNGTPVRDGKPAIAVAVTAYQRKARSSPPHLMGDLQLVKPADPYRQDLSGKGDLVFTLTGKFFGGRAPIAGLETIEAPVCRSNVSMENGRVSTVSVPSM